MNTMLSCASQAYFKNGVLFCGITDAFAFILTFFELSATVFNITVDARPVEEMVAQCRRAHGLAAGAQLLETYHTLTLQHVASCETFTSMLQPNTFELTSPTIAECSSFQDFPAP